MKKSVIILIGLIYVASIVLVSYLGLKAKSYNDITYAESLVIENDYEVGINGKEITVKANADGTATFQFICKVLPENAKNTKIIYTVDDFVKNHVTISESGLLTADDIIVGLDDYDFKVYIASDENPSIRDSVWIRFEK